MRTKILLEQLQITITILKNDFLVRYMKIR